MAATVAADPEVLARVRTDLGHVFPPLMAEARGPPRRPGPAPSRPQLVEPVAVVRRPLAASAPVAARARRAARGRAGRRRGGAGLGPAPPRAGCTVGAALPSRRPGTPAGRTARSDRSPGSPLRSSRPCRPTPSPGSTNCSSTAARPSCSSTTAPPASAGTGAGTAGSTWWVVDAWQALQGGVALARAVAPDAARGTRLVEEVPALRTLLVAGGRVPLEAVPIAGQAAALALTVGDVARLVGDGDPLAAARRDPLRYAGDVTQVGADVSSTACAVAPSVPACGAALGEQRARARAAGLAPRRPAGVPRASRHHRGRPAVRRRTPRRTRRPRGHPCRGPRPRPGGATRPRHGTRGRRRLARPPRVAPVTAVCRSVDLLRQRRTPRRSVPTRRPRRRRGRGAVGSRSSSSKSACEPDTTCTSGCEALARPTSPATSRRVDRAAASSTVQAPEKHIV